MWHSLKALSALALETAWVKVTELVSIHTMVSFCGVFLSIFDHHAFAILFLHLRRVSFHGRLAQIHASCGFALPLLIQDWANSVDSSHHETLFSSSLEPAFVHLHGHCQRCPCRMG
jgi:hypothetical protein